jgi:hypothetical protein
MLRRFRVLLVVSLTLIALPAAAEITNCTAITTLPYTISSPGIYCFTGDLSTSMTTGNAIEIQASSVTLDLNGHKLGGLGAGPGTQATGIYATDRKNISIRNGSIRGFYNGINVDDSGTGASAGHLLEALRLDGNTSIAIQIRGSGSIVRDNQIVTTGGSSLPSTPSVGIRFYGAGTRVLNNDITDVFGVGGSEVAIQGLSANGAVIRGNRMTNTTRDVSGWSRGIHLYQCNNVLIVDNIIEDTAVGVDYSSSSGKYRDNLTNAVDTPYFSGTDAGNNQ